MVYLGGYSPTSHDLILKMVPSQFNSRLDGVDINPGLTLFRKKITKNECVTPCPSLLFQHPSETILFGGLEQDFIFPYIGNNNSN